MNSLPQQIVNGCEALKQTLARAATEPRPNTDHPRIRIQSDPHRQVAVDEPASTVAAFSPVRGAHSLGRKIPAHEIAAKVSTGWSSEVCCCVPLEHSPSLATEPQAQHCTLDNGYACPPGHRSGSSVFRNCNQQPTFARLPQYSLRIKLGSTPRHQIRR